jgi:ribosomal protein S18 acetylase RimI-like enzyme
MLGQERGLSMQRFQIDGDSGRSFEIRVEEAEGLSEELIRVLLEIDLQTFSEATFSTYTAAVLLRQGRAMLLRADGVVIGTCVLIRCWDRPNEVMLLSMGIRPGWRGRGLGQRFLGAVMDRLRTMGIRAVSLLVGADNPRAIKVYEDVGFSVVETTLDDQRTGEVFLMLRCVLQDDAPVAELPKSSF